MRSRSESREGSSDSDSRACMTEPTCVCLIAVCAGVLGFAPFAAAQATTATLGGRIVDESGAVVPDARVSVVNLGTGAVRTTTGGAQGGFLVALLPPGAYRVTATRDGFAPAEIAPIVLNVGDDLDVKLLLRVAAVDAAVTVTAEAARVATSPAVATVVDRQFVANLPLNGRSFQSLITMTPGI